MILKAQIEYYNIIDNFASLGETTQAENPYK